MLKTLYMSEYKKVGNMFIFLFFKCDHSQYNWGLGKCRDIVMQIIRYWSLMSLGGWEGVL